MLGTPSNLVNAQLRLMLPIALISAFMNNTPVVAIMIPIVQQWSKRIDIPPSQLFIPLSFASILGGTCTLIGTSTNLVVAGKAEEDLGIVIGIFDLATVGVPVLFTGIIYVILFSPYLLPDAEELEKRQLKALGLEGQDGKSQTNLIPKGIGTDFTVSCLVQPNSDVCNQGVDQANLRGLHGLYLTSVQREGQVYHAVGPEFVINEYDILFFTGIVDNFPEFCLMHSFTPITADNEDAVNTIMHSEAGDKTEGGDSNHDRSSGIMKRTSLPDSDEHGHILHPDSSTSIESKRTDFVHAQTERWTGHSESK